MFYKRYRPYDVCLVRSRKQVVARSLSESAESKASSNDAVSAVNVHLSSSEVRDFNWSTRDFEYLQSEKSHTKGNNARPPKTRDETAGERFAYGVRQGAPGLVETKHPTFRRFAFSLLESREVSTLRTLWMVAAFPCSSTKQELPVKQSFRGICIRLQGICKAFAKPSRCASSSVADNSISWPEMEKTSLLRDLNVDGNRQVSIFEPLPTQGDGTSTHI